MQTQIRAMLGLMLCLSLTPGMPSYFTHAMSVSARSVPSESLNELRWQIETINDKGGFSSVLALDNNGYPQIAYQAQGLISPHDLNFARWTGSEWVIDVVDTQGDTGWVFDSLALDNAGNPHVGYGGDQYSKIKYASWDGSDWIVADVGYDPSDWGYSGASFTLDEEGYPHFAYCAQNPKLVMELRYAHWTGFDWSIEVIDSTGCWYSTSIGLDAHNDPGISYYDENHGELKYARWTGSEWDVQVVDGNGNVGRPNSLALDTNGYPHISYYSFTYDKLKYAAWTGTIWEIKDVDSIGGAIYELDIALVLDASNRPHIAYVDGNTHTVKYCNFSGSAWEIDIVDTGDYSISIRLDEAGNPHISYMTASYELKYAVGHPQPDIYLPLIMSSP